MVREELQPHILLAAYASGHFPMACEDDEIYWFSPDPRAIFPLEEFHVPKSLARVVRAEKFSIRRDHSFPDVIEACSHRQEGTWINREIYEAYCQLHELGYAHSVESWQDDRLVGGLYGVALGGAFFGESMFTRVRDASKVALVALVNHLRQQGFTLLDTQWSTAHLERFGCVEIARSEYLRRLAGALAQEVSWS